MSIRTGALTVQGLVALLSLFSGLCTIFVLIVTVADAWQEQQQQTWPETTATIERCSVNPHIPLRSATRTPVWHIQCRIAYSVGSSEVKTSIRSRSTTSSWGGSTQRMHQWITEHRSGTPIMIHYDTQKPTTAVLTATDMPYGGPTTPDDLKLLLIVFCSFVFLLLLAKYLRQTVNLRSAPAQNASM